MVAVWPLAQHCTVTKLRHPSILSWRTTRCFAKCQIKKWVGGGFGGVFPPEKSCVQRTPGGGQNGGGGGKTSRGDPPWKTVSELPQLGTFCPPPHAISLKDTLIDPKSSPHVNHLRNSFRRVSKTASTGLSLRGSLKTVTSLHEEA